MYDDTLWNIFIWNNFSKKKKKKEKKEKKKNAILHFLLQTFALSSTLYNFPQSQNLLLIWLY